MWQSSISAEQSDAVVLEQIGKQMMPLVDRFGGIVLRDSISDRERLSIAVSDRHAEQVKETLDDALAGVIGQHYKKKYIESEVALHGQPLYFERAFIQALVSFDGGFEREFIKSLIPESEVLSLDGLLRFRCEALKSRWNEICDLASETTAFSANREICLELIKFLLSTVDYETDLAVVTPSENGYALQLKSETGTTSAFAERDSLAATLIRYNPREVLVSGETEETEEIDFCREIFSVGTLTND